MTTSGDLGDFVVPFNNIDSGNVEKYGGKATNLAQLHKMGFTVPMGFSVTTLSFKRMISDIPQIREIIAQLEKSDDFEEMLELALGLQTVISSYKIPADIELEIIREFQNLSNIAEEERYGFAVRSSATIEDRSDVSFAGQAESFLCISKPEDIIDSVRKVWISGFSPSAVIYLYTKGIPISQMKMGVFVQEMICAEVSGVSFTANVVNNNMSEMLINSTWGLGDTLVSGKVIPDTFILSKRPVKVVTRELGTKEMFSHPEFIDDCVQMTIGETPPEKRGKFTLVDETVVQVAEMSLEIEKKMSCPQDIEWCIKDGQIIILQTRPITTLQNRSTN